jgi:formate hydrogenlyase subunit 6/NADH:ubiquinone oxidoreductase subunit I
MRRMPAFARKDDCVMCGDCFNICPNRAIAWQKKQTPVFEKEKCISCLCCVECCPQQALKAEPAGFKGLFLKYPEIELPHK